MKLKILILLIIIFSFASTAGAQGLYQDSTSQVIGAYRFYKDINNISISVPTVIEVPINDEFIERLDFAVFNKTANSFEPNFFRQGTVSNEVPMVISADQNTASVNWMIDNNAKTYAEFPLPDNAPGRVQITLLSPNPIASSFIAALLDDNVILPNSIEIHALVDGQNKIVLADQIMDQLTVHFPQTISNKWTIGFTYSQPLRISELHLQQDNAAKTNIRSIRFLAQPTHLYRVYLDPDRTVSASIAEAGNLVSAKDIQIVPAGLSQNNPAYITADIDNDDIPDVRDNCVFVANPDQYDANNNKIGDMCDDFDKDEIINIKDNCPDNPNRDQKNTDGDSAGDACDKEESRITERHAWIPWAGIGFAALVLVILLVLTTRSTHTANQDKK
ncbi:MAG: thrombospondin type 3 repeat-containing protein [Patescibacteria group bacterium]